MQHCACSVQDCPKDTEDSSSERAQSTVLVEHKKTQAEKNVNVAPHDPLTAAADRSLILGRGNYQLWYARLPWEGHSILEKPDNAVDLIRSRSNPALNIAEEGNLVFILEQDRSISELEDCRTAGDAVQ